MKSDISGFHKLSPEEKAEKVKQFAALQGKELKLSGRPGPWILKQQTE